MEKREEKVLRIAALFDGRPGHEKQTRGVIHALQRITSVSVVSLSITRLSVLQSIANTCRVLLPSSGIKHGDVKNCDLLIGTGSQTHLSLLLYKKQYRIPAVTCMLPPNYLRSSFDICFVPIHDGIEQKANVFVTAGAPNCSINYGMHKPECGLILLGGIDEKSHFWHDDTIVSKVRKVIEREPNVHWTISSSPRTPEKTIQKIKKIDELYNNCSFFHYKETKKGWVEEQYNKSTFVWVTSDSISMIYEALTAGCTVGLFPMAWKKSGNKFQKNETMLFDKNMTLSFAMWEQNGLYLNQQQNINEAQRCAEHILETLWQKN